MAPVAFYRSRCGGERSLATVPRLAAVKLRLRRALTAFPGSRKGLDLSHWRIAFNGAEPVRTKR